MIAFALRSQPDAGGVRPCVGFGQGDRDEFLSRRHCPQPFPCHGGAAVLCNDLPAQGGEEIDMGDVEIAQGDALEQ